MDKSIATVVGAAALVAAVLCGLNVPAEARDVRVERCPGGMLTQTSQDYGDDLLVTGSCTVGAGTYQWRNVNIINGGSLSFQDATIDFWAKSILVENGGSLIAGSPNAPIGTQGGVVTIHLYGKEQGPGTGGGDGGQGIVCQTPINMGAPCGIDPDVWTSNGKTQVSLPRNVTDYFYQYDPLPYDDGKNSQGLQGFFGYKVLAVSYGGTLQLFGKKGGTYGTVDPSNSGTSWVRLNKTLNPGDSTLVLDRPVDWTAGDQIVVTTTDYLPGHSEQLTIARVKTDGQTITVQEQVKYTHSGQQYDLRAVPSRLGLELQNAETRAAVALLTRSIRIVSGGDKLLDPFPAASTGYFFGGHVIVRQGAQTVQIQGVEFYQFGQGGRIAHYPVHFHLARRTPASPNNFFVMDSSVHDSMTRWYVVHGTHGVTLARNVGYQSIGHGYYIEDGTEINNQFLSNIGIFARAAIQNGDGTAQHHNPRQVPGILAASNSGLAPENVPYYSDYDHPSVFWIMNGWNDFQYNMAAGAGACGVCYWLVPGYNSGPSLNMTWASYASLQDGVGRAGTTPLKTFVGNYCTSAMNSFNTVGNTAPCMGVVTQVPPGSPSLEPVPNPLAPAPPDPYYPNVSADQGRYATLCGPGDETNCNASSSVALCASGSTENCAITALDRYTSSFHWADTNFAAIWLRPQWYLLVNSVLSDVQNGGVTFVSGGGYTASDVVTGRWALARKDVFIGTTQPNNPYASNAGPFNPQGLRCDNAPGPYCLSRNEGISIPVENFAVNQRLFSIYDGPVYQDSNAYLDITTTTLTGCNSGSCSGSSGWMQAYTVGVPQNQGQCYLPNAAIGWKQPNGFYYPPAFHSTNLFFNNVDIRHFVIEPLFEPGTFTTDATAAQARYCTSGSQMFTGFTDIDRQTELNDDDGSLTGFVNTISVNEDSFFSAPVETIQCESDITTAGTAVTSPYDYVTTVVYPGCATSTYNNCGTDWAQVCEDPTCYGVPLYRQYLVQGEQAGLGQGIRMMGQATAQRSALTVNNGVYYIDTTVSAAQQSAVQLPVPVSNLNVFQANQTYYVFLLFAKPTTTQTYQLYVGPGFNPSTGVAMVQADITTVPLAFTQGTWPWAAPLYNSSTGILTVTVDMGFPAFQTAFAATGAGKCQPSSFCTWSTTNSQCQCALQSGDYLYNECSEKNSAGESAICSWAVKDFDCPWGGCFGFAVTLSSTFTTGQIPDPRPTATCFPSSQDWNVTFTPASTDLAGACFNPPVPSPQFCTSRGRRPISGTSAARPRGWAAPSAGTR
jgi:hypothetical protein